MYAIDIIGPANVGNAETNANATEGEFPNERSNLLHDFPTGFSYHYHSILCYLLKLDMICSH
jgi:hypothetical protein